MLPLGFQIQSARILPPMRVCKGCLQALIGRGVRKLTTGNPTDAGNTRRCLQTHALGGGRACRNKGMLQQGDALQICIEILVTAEMRDTPERVANSVKSVWSIHLKTRGRICMPCKEILSNICRKGWLVLANIT